MVLLSETHPQLIYWQWTSSAAWQYSVLITKTAKRFLCPPKNIFFSSPITFIYLFTYFFFFLHVCLKSLVTDLSHSPWMAAIWASKPPSDLPNIFSHKAWTNAVFNIIYCTSSSSWRYVCCWHVMGFFWYSPSHTSGLLTHKALEDCPLLKVTGINFCLEMPSLEASADKDGCGIDRY